MDLTEVTEKQRPSREQAAGRLHALAGALARHNGVEFERGGLPFTVHVPDETDLTLEIESGRTSGSWRLSYVVIKATCA